MINSRTALRYGAIGLTLALVFTACGGDDDDDVASTTEGAAAEDANFSVCLQGNVDMGVLNLLAAIDEMNSAGYDISTPNVSETEVCTDGVIRDEFQVGVGFSPVLAATEQGVDNLRVIGARTRVKEIIVAQDGIESCDDLDGKTFAIHSEGSVMAALVNRWQEQECAADVEMDKVIISGSGNRTQAFMVGEIDATGVETQDEATLSLEYEGQFNVLARFSETLPEFVSNAMYANTSILESEPDAITELLRRMSEVARRWIDDPAAYEAAMQEHLPEMSEEQRAYFVDTGAGAMFPINGGITMDGVEFSIGVFAEAGAIESEIPAEEIADLSYVEAAMDELGATLSADNE